MQATGAQRAVDRCLSIDACGIWMCALAIIITMSLDASDVIPQPPPSTALSHHVSGCCPAGRHGRGAWKDVSRRRQRPGLSIVSSVCWEDNANHPGALPIEGVLADGSH